MFELVVFNDDTVDLLNVLCREWSNNAVQMNEKLYFGFFDAMSPLVMRVGEVKVVVTTVTTD